MSGKSTKSSTATKSGSTKSTSGSLNSGSAVDEERGTKDFGTNSAGSGKHVSIRPGPVDTPWLDTLNDTMLA